MKDSTAAKLVGYFGCALGGWTIAEKPLNGILIAIIGFSLVMHAIYLEGKEDE